MSVPIREIDAKAAEQLIAGGEDPVAVRQELLNDAQETDARVPISIQHEDGSTTSKLVKNVGESVMKGVSIEDPAFRQAVVDNSRYTGEN